MKMRLAFVTALLLAGPALLADERPAVGIEKAAALAQAHLQDGGHDKTTWIAALTLEPDSVMRRKFVWYAKWSAPIALGGRKELGLEISMDGSVARAVDRKAPK